MTTPPQISCPTCTWRSKPHCTPARAAYALRRHSCTKRHQQHQRRAAARARNDAIDRTPQPCTHPSRHVHGTQACYVHDRCRCRPCADALNAAANHRHKQKAYGRWNNRIDAEPAREHVAALRAAGMGLKTISKASGVAHGTLWKLVYGKPNKDGVKTPTRRVHPDTAARLTAVTPTPSTLAGGTKIPATGTQRRLQALTAVGWSQRELARRVGIGESNLGRLMHHQTHVTAATARTTRDLYNELWDSPPPATTGRERRIRDAARSRAARYGWVPPLAWDDDEIDNPDAEPYTGQRQRRSRQVDKILDLVAVGSTLSEIAARTRMSRSDIGIALTRVGREDVWADLARALPRTAKTTGRQSRHDTH